MNIEKTPIEGLLIVRPNAFNDSRGYFFESYSYNKYSEIGITDNFVQDNISKSIKGVVRGLHYQVGANAQAKLCEVLKGKVIDIAVDLRFGSPTYGRHFSVELSEENHCQFYIPVGFAHGFSVLSEEAIFHYKCSAFYSKPDERAIIYNDTSLKIDWKITNPVVSEKDLQAVSFSEIGQDFIFKS